MYQILAKDMRLNCGLWERLLGGKVTFLISQFLIFSPEDKVLKEKEVSY
jgi:hypothetical protein